MKTREEVIKHLMQVSYDKEAALRIMGFLLGNGIIQKGEEIEFRGKSKNKELNDFDYFFDWFVSEKCPLCGLIDFLLEKHEESVCAGNHKLAEEIYGYVEFLCEAFNLSVEEKSEKECSKCK